MQMNEAVKHGWEVSIFDFPSCIIKGLGDLEDLIKIIKNNTTVFRQWKAENLSTIKLTPLLWKKQKVE
jgi:hypothetical protein